MSVLTKLKTAKARIENPKNWCQRSFARDAKSYGVSPMSSDATSWCAIGALITVPQETVNEHRLAEDVLDLMAARMGHDSASVLNDNSDHFTVLTMFDNAIRYEEEKERAKAQSSAA